MIWAALLLSVSGFSWFLTVAINSPADTSPFIYGLIMLVVVAIIPTLLGFNLNRRLLASNPMVVKIIIINLLLHLVYCGIIAIGSKLIFPELFNRQAYIFYYFWLLVFWLIGTVYAHISSLASAPPSNVRAVEISLILIIPAVFLLTFKGLPISILLTVIAIWFLILTVTLAIEGRGKGESDFRFELVFFQALITVALAGIFFIIAFYGQMRLILLKLKEGVITLWHLLIGFLNRLFSEQPEVDPQEYSSPVAIPNLEEIAARDFPISLIIISAIIGIILLGLLMWALIKLMRMRLNFPQVSSGEKHSFIKSLAQLGKYLISLIKYLFQENLKVFRFMQLISAKVLKRIGLIIKDFLPARTPYQKVFRSYKALVRWGGRMGFFRRQGETPLEFTRRLENSTGIKPYPGKEINELTAIFLEAQYSDKPVSLEKGERSQMLLKRIKKEGRGGYIRITLNNLFK